jgi:hypothetical protein
MTAKRSHAAFLSYRAELMAELFLQELQPVSLLRSPSIDTGFDFLASFSTNTGRINTFAVEVKATEKEIESRFAVGARGFHRLVNSNVPGFYLIADVKRNGLFYSWPNSRLAESEPTSGTVSISVTKLTDNNKKILLTRLRSLDPSRPSPLI